MKSISVLIFSILLVGILFSGCQKKNVEDTLPNDQLSDPVLTDQEYKVLEDASININPLLDSLKTSKGKLYSEIFADPKWKTRADSLKNAFRMATLPVQEQLQDDVDLMMLLGAWLSHENTLPEKVLPPGGPLEPEQMAYAYVQRIWPQVRQIKSREFPNTGNAVFRKYKLLGIDCSGFLMLLLKTAGFQNVEFSFQKGTFQPNLNASVKARFNNKAELINLGNLAPAKLKRGDFMAWSGHGAIVDRLAPDLAPAEKPIAYQSNGTPNPKGEAGHLKNYKYMGVGETVRAGISVKDYNWLRNGIGSDITIFRIVPSIDKGEKVSGDNQQGEESRKLAQPLRVKVLDKDGQGISDVKVAFQVSSGGGSVSSAQAETGPDGIASVEWTLGRASAGDQKVTATVKNYNGQNIAGQSLTFSASIGTSSTVTDIDGNVYQTVKIGTQTWMKSNLKTTKYRDGSAITTGLSDSQWENTTSGAYAIFNNNAANDATYGKLYNWYTVADPRGLCPAGWHVPTDTEWKTLEAHFGMPASELDQTGGRGEAQNVGGKLKAVSSLWTSPNTGATDESGFSGLPGGSRINGGPYNYIRNGGFCWSSSENFTTNAWYRNLSYLDGVSNRYNIVKQYGFSVRCVKD